MYNKAIKTFGFHILACNLKIFEKNKKLSNRRNIRIVFIVIVYMNVHDVSFSPLRDSLLFPNDEKSIKSEYFKFYVDASALFIFFIRWVRSQNFRRIHALSVPLPLLETSDNNALNISKESQS